MKVYYLDDEDASAELGRLRRDLHLQEKDSSLETDKEMKEAEVTSYKNFLADTLEKKIEKLKMCFLMANHMLHTY
ncbi:hypothetical protein [Oceanobacillus massiliensis]|uniref:hypothetical protein n=1 Tax=Oceanobacillus massiliensis TaxID=1465765 RepID=UPI001F39F720|nr:hypothetical protein [Oceanobacillus massiliensis]